MRVALIRVCFVSVLTMFTSEVVVLAQHPAPMGHPLYNYGQHRNQTYGNQYYPNRYYPNQYYGNPYYRDQYKGASTQSGNFQNNNFQNAKTGSYNGDSYNAASPTGQTQIRQSHHVYSNVNASPSVSARSGNLRILDQLGIRLQSVTSNGITRLVVTDVAINGLAYQNGIRRGHALLRANGQTLTNANDLAKAALRISGHISLTVLANGQTHGIRINAPVSNRSEPNIVQEPSRNQLSQPRQPTRGVNSAQVVNQPATTRPSADLENQKKKEESKARLLQQFTR